MAPFFAPPSTCMPSVNVKIYKTHQTSPAVQQLVDNQLETGRVHSQTRRHVPGICRRLDLDLYKAQRRPDRDQRKHLAVKDITNTHCSYSHGHVGINTKKMFSTSHIIKL